MHVSHDRPNQTALIPTRVPAPFRGLSLLVAVVLLTTGCRPVTAPSTGPDSPPLKVAVNVWPGFAPVYFAKDRGLFQQNGVDVELVLNQEIADSYRLFDSGKVDACFSVLSDVVSREHRRTRSKVVLVADYSMSADLIVGRGEAGDLASLKGGTIAHGGLNTFSHLLVLKSLELAGVDELDVRYRTVEAHKVVEELEAGLIDAGHTWEPTASLAFERGYHRLGSAADLPGLITDVLIFDPRVVEERRSEVVGFVKAFVEAVEEIIRSPDDGIATMAKAIGMSDGELRSGLEGIKLLDLTGNILAFQRRDEMSSLYHAVDVIGAFLQERGQLEHAPDAGLFLEPQFIKELAYHKVP